MVDLIIPVYKPKEDLACLLKKIAVQTVVVNKIILMNTEEKYWNEFVKFYPEVNKYEKIEVHHFAKEDFEYLLIDSRIILQKITWREMIFLQHRV